MKIVHALGWYFPDSLGGSEVYVAGLCRRLMAAGHHVLVAAPLAGLEAPSSYVHDGVAVFRYPVPVHPTRDECQSLVPARGAEHFHEWLERQRPDVVHFHTFSTGLGLPEIDVAKGTGARLVATSHLAGLGYVCQRGTLMRWGTRPCDAVCGVWKCAACELQHRGLPRLGARAVAAAAWPLGKTSRWVPGSVGSALGMPDVIRRNQYLQTTILAALDCFVLLNRGALDAVAVNGAPRDKLVVNYMGVSHTGCAAKPGPAEQPTRAPVRIGYFGRLVEIKGVFDLARAVASLPSSVPTAARVPGPDQRCGQPRGIDASSAGTGWRAPGQLRAPRAAWRGATCACRL